MSSCLRHKGETGVGVGAGLVDCGCKCNNWSQEHPR